jgi:hypothetical protein
MAIKTADPATRAMVESFLEKKRLDQNGRVG